MLLLSCSGSLRTVMETRKSMERMDGWMDEWTDGWIDRWMDGWMDE